MKNKELILRNISNKIKELPTLPEVVTKITKLTSDPFSNVKDIVELISKDQSLTLKVLKMSNSAFYGLARKVLTAEHAVKVLGFKVLRSIVLSASASAFFKNKRKENEKFDHELWYHSLMTAVAARQLADMSKYRSLADECYIAGLIHDLGKKVINDYFQMFYQRLEKLLEDKEVNPLSVENQALGFDHTDVGSRVAKAWLLPDSLVEAIEFHHFPKMSVNHRTYTFIIYTANILATYVDTNPEDNEFYSTFINNDSNFEKIGIRNFKITEFNEILKEDYEAEKGLFDI